MNKRLALLFKLTLAIVAFYVVFNKVSFNEITAYIYQMDKIYLSLALVAIFLSQIISAFRMRYYFVANNIRCNYIFAISLYFVGMFYNAILPGGITGDGYKIFIMEKLENVPKLTSLRLVLSNRANGLYLLLLITIILAFFSPQIQSIEQGNILLIVLAVITSFSYFFLAKVALKEKISVAFKATQYSLLIQILSLLSAYLLLCSINKNMANSELINYLILFMASCIVSILPISIGGAGLRELTFLYGAQYFHLDMSIGVAFSMIFFALNLLLSLCGIFFTTDLKKIHLQTSRREV